MELKANQVSTIFKCVSKVHEILELLGEHGIKIYQVTDISVLDINFGSATLVVNLDCREKKT